MGVRKIGIKALPDIKALKKRLHAELQLAGNATEEQAAVMKDTNTEGWIATMLSVSGSSLTHSSVHIMLTGNYVPEATIEESQLADSCHRMRREFSIMCDMHTTPDTDVIRHLHELLAGPGDYRKGTPRLKEMNHTPPHGSGIPALMKKIQIDMAAEDFTDTIDEAVRLHDSLMYLWPFDDYNDATAYAAMSYKLLRAGYPLPTMELTQYEHRRLAAEYVHAGTSDGLTALLLINLIKECRLPGGADRKDDKR